MAELVRFSECPLCGKPHSYELDVGREIIPGLATQPQALRQVAFRRHFACPEDGQSFQAKITLTETAMNPIVSVRVAGPVETEEG